MNEKWRGGDVANGPGGGHKINILKNALKEYKNDNSTVIMFTDRYQQRNIDCESLFLIFLLMTKNTVSGAL